MSLSITLGPAVASETLHSIERRLQLDHSKWDTQVGDTHVLSAQPLLIAEETWAWLCGKAEAAACELFAIECEIAASPKLQERIGVPRPFRKLLPTCRFDQRLRTLRFDFHPTADGWAISEVNSDVPGGFGEARALPELFRPFVDGVVSPTDPLSTWGDTVESEVERGSVALLHAPGYLEDQQVVLILARELNRRGFRTHLIQSPEILDWKAGGIATITRAPHEKLSGVIRFFQAEWLANLPKNSGWQKLFTANGFTRVSNPTHCVISESKRLPLSFPFIKSKHETLSQLFPKCTEPKEISGRPREDWVLKGSYANTGDAVYMGGEMPQREWDSLLRRAWQRPSEWIAQERFDTLNLESQHGAVRPCVGVFVIGGRAAGAYVRLSRTRVTDAYAFEAPLFIVSEVGRK